MSCSILLIQASAAPAQERPSLLMPLYVSNVMLQGLDVHSTMIALDRGHLELNPLFRDRHAATMIGVKAGATVASIWLSERLWKRHRGAAAVLVMIGVNVGMTAVVANNYHIAFRPSRD